MEIKLTLYKSVILEAVKAETQIKSVIDRSSDNNAVQLAYHEAAGDEEMHERKLLRCIETSLATFKVELASFLDSIHLSQGHNVYSTTAEDAIYIHISVSKRFNTSMIDPLAKLCSKFIEDNTLVLWWGAIGDQKQSQFYQAQLLADMAEIKVAFSKLSPVSVDIPYTSSLSVSPGSTITIAVGQEETLTYTIDEGAIDDIEIMPDNGSVKTRRGKDCFLVKGMRPGLAHCMVYSVHDENVYEEIDVIVASE